MTYTPLPDDFEATAYDAESIIHILHKDVGIPMDELRRCDLQELYDLVIQSVPDDLRERYQRLVVIDEVTGKELLRDLQRTVAYLRPNLRDFPHNIELMARREALMLVPHMSRDASVQELEAALKATGRSKRLVLEDADYDDYGIRANRIISRRPHGRSPEIISTDLHEEANGFDERVAEKFLAALVALTLTSPRPSQPVSDRQVGHICTKVGNETTFARMAEESDLVVLGFEPGQERYGPVNIAVYEKRDGKVILWPRCSPWCGSDGSNFMIISDDCKAAFAFALPALLRIDYPAPEHLQDHIEIARMVLKRTQRNAEVD